MIKSILIIDDDEFDQKIIKHYLSKEGYSNLNYADSGEEGIEMIVNDQPDLVIVDTNLPGMDGFDVCKKVRDDYGEKIYVIIVTGLIDSVNDLKSKQVGANDYCAKTDDCAELIKSIQSLT